MGAPAECRTCFSRAQKNVGIVAGDSGAAESESVDDGGVKAVPGPKRKAAAARGPPNLTMGLPDQSNVQNRKHVIDKLSEALTGLNDRGDVELRAAEQELVGINTKKAAAEVASAVSLCWHIDLLSAHPACTAGF